MARAKGDSATKHCGSCQRVLGVDRFYRNAARSDGLSGYCVECQRISDTKSRQALRARVLAMLGNRCSNRSCEVPGGMDDPRALQIDHIEGGGTAERALLRSGDAFLRTVLHHPERYQLLCANCNAIRRIELGQHVGRRVYERTPPTERRLLRSDPDWQKAHGERTRRYWADHPDQLAERNQRISTSRKRRS